jgi:hypothetical protein
MDGSNRWGRGFLIRRGHGKEGARRSISRVRGVFFRKKSGAAMSRKLSDSTALRGCWHAAGRVKRHEEIKRSLVRSSDAAEIEKDWRMRQA